MPYTQEELKNLQWYQDLIDEDEQQYLQRKSLFTRKNISKGEKITLENITIKGPGHGLFPKYLNLVLGKKVTKDIPIDSPLTWDDLLNK